MMETFYILYWVVITWEYTNVKTNAVEVLVLLHFIAYKSTKRNEKKIKTDYMRRAEISQRRQVVRENSGGKDAGIVISGQTEEGLINIVNTRFYPKSNGQRLKKFNQQGSMFILECLS